MKLSICHLYASGMNTYGDRGNVLALVQRCRWRGIEVDVVERALRDRGPLTHFDLLIAGGGQDREQTAVSEDLNRYTGAAIAEAVEQDLVALTICGTYQLLGRSFKTHEGEVLPGVGIFDAWTEAGKRRMIGDVAVHASLGGQEFDLIGFENHGGETYLGPGVQPLGKVLIGDGNNGSDGFEGAVYRNAFGSYLHGPLLPKNPEFADYLLTLAIRRRVGDDYVLPPLDDTTELRTRSLVLERMKRRGRVKSGVR